MVRLGSGGEGGGDDGGGECIGGAGEKWCWRGCEC